MLNQVQLIGFTGAEAEIRTTQGGKKVATLRVCTNRYTKKGGERKDYPTWHQVEIWNQATVNWLASKPLPKGAKVFGKRVTVKGASRAGFLPLSCGGSCSPPQIDFSWHGVLYTIQANLRTKQTDRAALIAAAQSAISAGPR